MNPTILRFLIFVGCILPISAQTTPSTPFCLGDGTGAPCPCGISNGAPGHGCANLDWPAGAPNPIHVAGQTQAGDQRAYQVWYRDADLTFCTSATFNLTNGVSVTWAP